MKKIIILSILAAVAIIGLFVFLNMSSGEIEEASGQSKKRIAQKKSLAVEVPVATNEVKKVEEKKSEYVKKPGQMQLPNGRILTFPPPKAGTVRKVYAGGHMYECDSEGNFRDISERKLFKTAFELNFLALSIAGRQFIPAFLVGLDEADVKRMLTKPYEPIGDETKEELEKLQAYDNMRKAALDYMAEGGKFDDFVQEFAKFEKDQRSSRATGLREVMQLFKQGKVQEAKDMADAADIILKEKGYKPITWPKHVQEAFKQLK